jgi:hypothetical protein
MRRKFGWRNLQCNTAKKRKNPALPGFFDEYVFRSAYFASLAI